MRLGKLPGDAAIERGIVLLLLRLERERGELQRVEDVPEVQFRDRAD